MAAARPSTSAPIPRRYVMPVVDLQHGSSAVTRFRSGGTVLGSVRAGAVGSQGASPAPGALLPRTLDGTLPAGSSPVTRHHDGDRR